MTRKTDLIILILLGIIFAGSLLSLFSLDLNEDFMALVPDELSPNGNYRELLDTFNPLDQMFLLIESPDEEPDRAAMIAIADSLFAEMEASGHFGEIIYSWDMEDLSRTTEKMLEVRSVLLDDSDRRYVESLADAAVLSALFADWKRLLYTSSDPLTSRQFREDPFRINERILAKWTGLGGQDAMTVYQGRLFTRDYRIMLIIAAPLISSSDSGQSGELIAFMDSLAEKTESGTGYKLHFLSGHSYTEENASRIKRDVKLTVTLSLLVILLMTLAVYRRPLLSLYAVLPSFFGVVVAAGVCRWIFSELSMIVIGCGSMLIGITVDYGIHLLFHTDPLAKTDFRSSIRRHLREIRLPLTVSGLTTVGAFLVLLFSRMPGYRQLGVFSAVGVASALVFVLFVFPFIIPPPIRFSRAKPLVSLNGFWKRFFGLLKGRELVFLGLFTAALVFAGFGLNRVDFDGDVSRLNAKNENMIRTYELLDTAVDAFYYNTSVGIAGSSEEEVLKALEDLAVLAEDQRQRGLVESYATILPVLPSEGTQYRRLAAWETLFADESWNNRFTGSLESAAAEHGLNPALWADAFEGIRPPEILPLTASHYQETILEPLIRTRLARTEDGYMALMQLRISDSEDLQQVSGEIIRLRNDVIIYNEELFTVEIMDLIFSEMRKMGLIMAALVLVLIFVFIRNWKKGLAILLPILSSVLLTFGLMGWMNIRLNLINCLVIVFIFGLVIDYAVFLVSAFWPGSSVHGDETFASRSSSAILLSALTTMTGLGILILARHPALHTLGSAALLGISCGLVSVFFITPIMTSLLNAERKKP